MVSVRGYVSRARPGMYWIWLEPPLARETIVRQDALHRLALERESQILCGVVRARQGTYISLQLALHFHILFFSHLLSSSS